MSTELNKHRRDRETTRIEPAHARSWQLVSAESVTRYSLAQLGDADQIILDLEDAVDTSRKSDARDRVINWFTAGGSAWVRINDATVDHWSADVDMLKGVPGLSGVVLAKVEGPDEVTETFERLGRATPVIPLVESALGIELAMDIARARGAFRLAFGSGDYRKDTGAENIAAAMAYPRTKLVLASRVGGLPGPIDGPTPPSTHAVVREHIADAVALGMTGKLCLDLEQPAIINESMSPTPSDVAWAHEFLTDFEARGRVVRDGSDKPRLGRAERIRERAALFAIPAPKN